MRASYPESLTPYERPEWHELAACRGADPEIFFRGQGQEVDTAKRICAGCPVQLPCLQAALERGEKFGVWGGMSEKQRRRIRRERKIA